MGYSWKSGRSGRIAGGLLSAAQSGPWELLLSGSYRLKADTQLLLEKKRASFIF
jgi:hypothetical protein